jgi:hypothetical protein
MGQLLFEFEYFNSGAKIIRSFGKDFGVFTLLHSNSTFFN